MAAKTFGTAHLYGIAGTVTNATVVSFSDDDSHAVADTTVNESGVIIERRYDDVTTDASITLKIQAGYTIPAIGTQLTYDSTLYIIETVSRPQEAQGFRQVTLGLKTSEGITLV